VGFSDGIGKKQRTSGPSLMWTEEEEEMKKAENKKNYERFWDGVARKVTRKEMKTIIDEGAPERKKESQENRGYTRKV